MKKRTAHFITLLVAVILLALLAACSSEQNGYDTKAPSNTTVPNTSLLITTESVVPTHATNLPATTEAQTEPPAIDPVVDISGIVFKEENLNGGSYVAPKDWECKESGHQKYYYADVPTGAYIFVDSYYRDPSDPFSAIFADDDAFVDFYRANWPNCTPISTTSMMINNFSWIFDKLETEDNHIVDCRYYFRGNDTFYSIAFYPKEGNQVPRFQAIYEKMFESIDLTSLYIERPLTSLMDLKDDIVLIDDDYVKITYQGMETDMIYSWAYPLVANFLIENKTDKSIVVTIGSMDLSVNEFMCDAMMYAEMKGNKKTNAQLGFTEENLKQAHITSPYEIQEMEWTFHIFEDGTFKTIEDLPAKLSIYD